jgi:hypothetical protein
MAKRKRTNNDLQDIYRKTRVHLRFIVEPEQLPYRKTRVHLRFIVEFMLLDL